MAHEVEKRGDASKVAKNGDFIYELANGNAIHADVHRNQYFYFGEFKGDTPPVKFVDITQNYGTTNIVEYIDYVLDNGLAWTFDVISVPGVATEVKQDIQIDLARTSDIVNVTSQIPVVVATNILVSNPNRKEFLVYNNSNRECYLKLGAGASLIDNTTKIDKQALFTNDTYSGIVSVIFDNTGTGQIQITEIDI